MKLQSFTILSALLATVSAHNLKARHNNVLHKRQNITTTGSTTTAASIALTTSSSSAASSAAVVPTSDAVTTAAATQPTAATTSAAISTGSSTSGTTGVISITTIPLATGTGIPPLANITSGMPTRVGLGAISTYSPGATPPISGVPTLPTAFVFQAGAWPAQDKVPDTNTPEVAAWMKELEGFSIPSFSPTADGSCAGDPAAAADAANRGWWTCGGYTRATDITSCPDKLTWGVSFDDGPSPYTQYLLNYLTEKDIQATFFVVGSRVIERPGMVIEEYMTGHEISVHTWSHPHLTTLTNEQIVAELGWTRKAIKNVLGVTPTTMRPPYGDIDDRVRAISLAMGMVPLLWTRTPEGFAFDTNDWKVPGGLVNGTQSFETFQTILSNASTTLETGFIVLEHDLFEITVDLAVGYTLDAALNFVPELTLQPIGECIKMPNTDLYRESTQNLTFPYRNVTGGGIDTDGNGQIDDKDSPAGGGTQSSAFINSIPMAAQLFLVALSGVGFLL